MSSADKGCFKEKESISVPLEDAPLGHEARALPGQGCHFGWGQLITMHGHSEVLLLQAGKPIKPTHTNHRSC